MIDVARAIQRVLKDAGLYGGEIDGNIGPRTDASWMMLKSKLRTDTEQPDDRDSPFIFSRPKVLSDAQVENRFGKLNHTENRGSIVPSEKWVKENIVRVRVPAIEGKPLYTEFNHERVSNLGLTMHRLMVEPLTLAMSEIVDRGFHMDILTFDGLYNPRMVRGSKDRLSRHSWGIAIDLNAPWNGLGNRPAAMGAKGSLWRIVPIMEKYGFVWGGRWKRPDAMHFELGEKQ
jgi:hypothetical protein